MGTRALANFSIGGPASTGIGTSNAAGGFGNPLGSAASSSGSVIQLQVVGAGQAVRVTFDDLVQQVAATDSLSGESSFSQISNVLSVFDGTTSQLLARFEPAELNQVIRSFEGVPARNTSGPTLYRESFVSPVLASGATYVFSLASSSAETIVPGRVPVPEPASLALFGAALSCMAWPRLRRSIRNSLRRS